MHTITAAQELTDLETLDHWTLQPGRTFECCRYDRHHAIAGLAEAQHPESSKITALFRLSFSGPSTAAARHAAAEHIRATDGMVFVRGAR